MSTQETQGKSEGEYTADGKERYLVTAGGRIRCLRCTARSSRTKLQCAKPALKFSTTQKCGHHGGLRHSAEVLRRIIEANTLHGECSKQAKEQYRQDAVQIRHLEDAMHVLRMGDGPRMRGRKPNGYRGVHTEADVVRVIRERLVHHV
jgi:hypothetical protein